MYFRYRSDHFSLGMASSGKIRDFMQTVIVLVLCFLGAWLIANLNHKAKFIELFTDLPQLLIGMLVAFVALFLLYGILRLGFEPFFNR